MNLGRIIGVVLSIMFALSFINNNIDNNEGYNPFELIGDSGTATLDEVNYNKVSLNEEKSSNTEVIKYTNNQPYSIDLTASNINVNCDGVNMDDVEMVNQNMKVNALFSRLDSDKKSSSITIKSKETIYIYLVNEYVGEFPSSEVMCNYSVAIQDF